MSKINFSKNEISFRSHRYRYSIEWRTRKNELIVQEDLIFLISTRPERKSVGSEKFRFSYSNSIDSWNVALCLYWLSKHLNENSEEIIDATLRLYDGYGVELENWVLQDININQAMILENDSLDIQISYETSYYEALGPAAAPIGAAPAPAP